MKREQIEETVEWFSNEVIDKLTYEFEKKGKGDWKAYSLYRLFRRLLEEVAELAKELLDEKPFSPRAVILECADVSALAMFIAEKCEEIERQGMPLKPKKE